MGNVLNSKTIKHKDTHIENVTFSGGMYATIISSKPSGMNNFLFAGILNFPSGVPISVSIDGRYAFMHVAGGGTIEYIDVRYYYTD